MEREGRCFERDVETHEFDHLLLLNHLRIHVASATAAHGASWKCHRAVVTVDGGVSMFAEVSRSW